MEKNHKDTEMEMEILGDSSTESKSRRFQVNKVRTSDSAEKCAEIKIESSELSIDETSESEEEELVYFNDRTRLNNTESDAKYGKSFRHLTREALPRLDNYRNILSFQAGYRPTLDELHNATLLNKSQTTNDINNGKLSDSEGQLKFGWIQGVLVRCLLNIWGVMLFLRLTWVVGQAGVIQAIVLILLTSCVTTITALSMSAISTNGVIKGGGTYYMISRSLGPEFGASIGLIFSLANAVACAMYIVGFCESMRDFFHVRIIDGGVRDVQIVGCITIVILLGIVVFGMEWEAKAQNVLLVILVLAIFDFLIGSFIGPKNDEAKAKGFLGYNITILKDNLESDYRASEEIDGNTHTFFSVFAVFFPAATGILAGANISGDLKDPSKAIPKGTLLAIFITTLSYVLMGLVAGFCVVRDASGNITDFYNGTFRNCSGIDCEYGLLNSFQIVELVSWVGPIIYAGCFAAALSSALASLVSAPKVFQALCKDKLYPYTEWFAKGYGKNNEPIRGYLLTFIIAVCFILIGKLNLIAPLISNFFLAAYTLINFSTFHASLAKPVGWRPTFKYYNMWLSLLGAILCVVVMFLISWWTALLTLSAILALYLFVSYRKPDVNWGSTTQAQIYKNALQAAHQLNNVEDHVKNYRPQILVLSGMPSARPALIDFSNLITKNLSVLICGHINGSILPQRIRNFLSYKGSTWLKAHKIKAFYTQIDGVTFAEGAKALLKTSGIGKLKPNILLMGHKADWQKCSKQDLDMYFEVLHTALDLHYAIAILRLQQGLEFNTDNNVENEEDFQTSKLRSNSFDFVNRDHLYDQMSQASSSSYTSTPVPQKKTELVSTSPNPSEDLLSNKKRMEDLNIYSVDKSKIISKESEMFLFQKKQKHGTIDVWWLYDDGGLTLLLPYIIRNRRSWSSCTLRVFTLANKRNELEVEQRNMASMLAKFRIDYSDLKIVPDVTSPPQDSTLNFFHSLIADFRETKNNLNEAVISDSELLSMKDKTNRHLRLRELLLENSQNASFVVMTLPVPRKNVISAPLYLAWLEILTRDMPPFLLVRGNQSSVLTFYS